MPRRARMALSGACIGVLLLVVSGIPPFTLAWFAHADATILNGFLGLGWPAPRPGGELDRRAVRSEAIRVPGGAAGAGRLAARPPARRDHARADPAVRQRDDRAAEAAAGRPTGSGQWLVDAASWPSGHATAAMSLCLCWVIAVSARWRPAVGAVMAAFAIAVSYSFLTLGWHYPSDVLGGFLIAAVWSLLGSPRCRLYEHRLPSAVAECSGAVHARAGAGSAGRAGGRRARAAGGDRRSPARTR